jgi:hypothetical protein
MSNQTDKYRESILRQSELFAATFDNSNVVDSADIFDAISTGVAAHTKLEKFVANGGDLSTLSDSDFVNLLKESTPAVKESGFLIDRSNQVK